MIKWLLIEWQYQSNGTIHLQLITYVIITDYILATVFNSSFTILSIGRGLFMCPLSHAAFIHFQKYGRICNGWGLLLWEVYICSLVFYFSFIKR